jgi:3-deoxy-D-manno-octulosonic-acid transferase
VDSLWVHAVSVGEVQAAAPLVRALRSRCAGIPLVLTTTTPTGAQRARSLFGDTVHFSYLPYDLPGSVRRFLDRVRPRLAVILETELWPNLFCECGRRGIPLVLASARVSPRSVTRYRRLPGLIRATLSGNVVVCAQSQADAARFVSIGADPKRTHVTGNIKFEFELPATLADEGARLRSRYAGSRPVWVAGSTHATEEDVVLDAHAKLIDSGMDAVLVLAPRHPDRFEEVAANLRRRGLEFVRRSRQTAANAGTRVVLADTLGELLAFYAAGDVAFVGGTLVPIGGHNLLEPAALGLPVLAGPNTFNAEDVSRLLLGVGAARQVLDADGLATELARLLRDPDARRIAGERGRAAVEANRGALERVLAAIVPLVG